MRSPLLASLALGMAIAPGAARAAPEGAKAREVPFELVRNEVLVLATVNGKGPFLMKVDPGAEPSQIDIHTALSLGLTLNPAGAEGEGGEEGSVFDTRLASLELGGVSSRDVDAFAGGMVAKIGMRLERKVVGVLGHGFFAGRIVQFDYPSRKLRFLTDPPGGAPGPARAELPFKDDENVLVENVSIRGLRVNTAIDVGSASAVSLSAASAARLGVEKELAGGRVPSLSAGPLKAESVPAVVLPEAPARDRKPWEATLGNEFLKDYVLTIDYPDLKVILEKP